MDLQKVTEEALHVVETAAAFIRANLYNVRSDQVDEKGLNSLVSFVDRQAEEILVKGLSAILPEAGILSEEETVEQARKQLTWIIDPLDGTTNFLHSVPYFSVSVALADGPDIIAGIVHEVMHNEVFIANTGSGAFLNGKPIHVSPRVELRDILVGTGFPYNTSHVSDGHFAALRKVLMTTRGIRRIGSAALDLCYVACGRFGAFYEHTLNPWDIAAGALIVREAGGLVSDYGGEDQWLSKGEILATAPQFLPEMLEICSEFCGPATS